MRSSSSLVLTLTAILATTAHAAGLPVCDAKHKRPANPYGSVLSQGLKPALAATAPVAGSASEPRPAAPNAAMPPQVLQASHPASFAPCGGPRS